jgi:formylglycine-generating enzyme required for sulfatase activity
MMARSWPRLCKLSERDHDDNARAKQIIEKFLAEFDTLKTAVPTKEIIAQDLVFTEIELQGANVEVEVGHYVMGDDFKDNPQHKEKLAGTFALSKYPITRRLYACFDPNHIKHFTTEFENFAADERCPVICITFWDAWMFAVWCGGRLPTEWEWEFACRADCRDKDNRLSLYYWPDDNEGDRLKDHAWCKRNSDGKTRRVGILQPNKYGLHDMLGNVWEWTDSIYEAGGVSRVLRGGSFFNFGRLASASFRNLSVPTFTDFFFGFRVARAPKGKS